MLLGGLKKVLFLLSSMERKKLIGVLGLSTLTTLIDTVGILSIFPFLQVVLNPKIINENKWLAMAYDFGKFQNSKNFLICMGVALLVIFTAGNILKGFSLWYSNQFAYNCNRVVSTQLLRNYFTESYLENIKKNSAHVASHLLTNVDLGISNILNSWIGIFSSGFLVLLLLGILFATQPMSALITFIGVGIFYYFLERSIKFQIGELGQTVIRNSSNLYKSINESTGGVKEIKYLGRSEKFIKDYDNLYREYVDLKSKNNLYQFMPKLVVDTLAFGIGVTVIIFVLGTSENLTTSIPWMGLFAFITLRLIPNSQIILQQVSKLRYSNNALDLIHQDFKRMGTLNFAQIKQTESLTFHNSIKLENISFSYTSNGKDILNGISFQINRGEMVAFVGKTGAGKTTIIDILLGLIGPTQGSILIDEIALNTKNMLSWQKQIGYVPQFVFLADDTIMNNVAFGIESHSISKEAIIEACKKANIHDFIMEKLPLGYNTIIGERGVQLSGGQRQRLGIARALYHDPAIIILDEATSALDNQTEINVMDEINKIAGIKTIVIIAHRLSTVEKCDKIFLLENGKVISSGNYLEMITKEPSFFSKVT